ncbi:uncharacterized protein LOC143017460 [Oratosquilla oratoria]|uniref:uncharacterized protein LOC143017460 n=1 Tax=Oratosquilla oratoria TaxID=337810 RepID=UPI003F75F469
MKLILIHLAVLLAAASAESQGGYHLPTPSGGVGSLGPSTGSSVGSGGIVGGSTGGVGGVHVGVGGGHVGVGGSTGGVGGVHVGVGGGHVGVGGSVGIGGGLGGPCSDGLVRDALGRCVQPEVSREVFVYQAPHQDTSVGPTPEVPRPKVNYNIVFVRTPERPAGSRPIVVPPPQQKTIVYVLSKKGSTSGPEIIEVPAAPGQSPEVYYVSYDEGENPQLPGGISLQEALASAATLQGTDLGFGGATGLGSGVGHGVGVGGGVVGTGLGGVSGGGVIGTGLGGGAVSGGGVIGTGLGGGAGTVVSGGGAFIADDPPTPSGVYGTP